MSGLELIPILAPIVTMGMKAVCSKLSSKKAVLQKFEEMRASGFDQWTSNVYRDLCELEPEDLPDFIEGLREQFPTSQVIQKLQPRTIAKIKRRMVDFSYFEYQNSKGDAGMGKIAWCKLDNGTIGCMVACAQVKFKLHRGLMTRFKGMFGSKQKLENEVREGIELYMQKLLVDDLASQGLLTRGSSSPPPARQDRYEALGSDDQENLLQLVDNCLSNFVEVEAQD